MAGFFVSYQNRIIKNILNQVYIALKKHFIYLVLLLLIEILTEFHICFIIMIDSTSDYNHVEKNTEILHKFQQAG